MDRTDEPGVAIVGAGAIAAVMAAAALDAGHHPTICVRSPIPALVLESSRGRRQLPVRVVGDPEDVGPTAWVLVTVKAQDTASTAPWLARLCGPDTVVVALQNGIGHRERLAPFVGPASVLPALLNVAAERVSPGLVVHHSGRRVTVPEGADGARFAALLVGGGLDVVQDADIVTASWRKLLSNAVANPLTALTMRRLDVMGDPGIEQLGRAIMAEAVAVAQAEGAHVGQRDIDDTFERLGSYRTQGTSGSSMYYDRLAGLPLEHSELTGAVVRAARRHGIPTPLNDGILALLAALDRGRELDGGR